MEPYPIHKPMWFLRAVYILSGCLVGAWLVFLPFQGERELERETRQAQGAQARKPSFIIVLNETYRVLLQKHTLSNACLDLVNASPKQHELCHHQHELHSMRLQLARDKIERMYYFDPTFNETSIDVLALLQEQVRQLSQNDSTSRARPSQNPGV